MAEDSQSDDSAESPIPGLSTDDITPNIYEGGFKTWECALDLAEYLLNRQWATRATTTPTHVIEVSLSDIRVKQSIDLATGAWRALRHSQADSH